MPEHNNNNKLAQMNIMESISGDPSSNYKRINNKNTNLTTSTAATIEFLHESTYGGLELGVQ